MTKKYILAQPYETLVGSEECDFYDVHHIILYPYNASEDVLKKANDYIHSVFSDLDYVNISEPNGQSWSFIIDTEITKRQINTIARRINKVFDGWKDDRYGFTLGEWASKDGELLYFKSTDGKEGFMIWVDEETEQFVVEES